MHHHDHDHASENQILHSIQNHSHQVSNHEQNETIIQIW